MSQLFKIHPDSGRVTIVDLASGEILFMVNTALGVDAVFAPDQSTLYVADEQELAAFDLMSGTEFWRTAIQDRVNYILGQGPTTLAVAPDGSRLYVYSRRPLDESYGAAENVPYWLQAVDTTNGQVMADSEEIVGCGGGAQMSFSPNGSTLYLMCPSIAEVVAFDIAALTRKQSVDLPGVPETQGSGGQVIGSVASRDGETLYVVVNYPTTNTLGVAVVEAGTALTTREADLGVGREDGTVAYRVIALVENDTRLVLGVQTGSPYSGDIDQVRVFDTATWEEASRFDLPELHSAGVAIDPAGSVVYGATWELTDGTAIKTTSVVQIDLNGAVEPLFELEGQVLRMFTLS